jgi:hypothetical protein
MGARTKLAILLLLFIARPPHLGHCLTAEEIAYLKEAGVSNETINLMIEQENERRQQGRTGIWEVEDDHGHRSTLYRAGSREDPEKKRNEQEKVNRAWEMLQNLVIDTRERE